MCNILELIKTEDTCRRNRHRQGEASEVKLNSFLAESKTDGATATGEKVVREQRSKRLEQLENEGDVLKLRLQESVEKYNAEARTHKLYRTDVEKRLEEIQEERRTLVASVANYEQQYQRQQTRIEELELKLELSQKRIEEEAEDRKRLEENHQRREAITAGKLSTLHSEVSKLSQSLSQERQEYTERETNLECKFVVSNCGFVIFFNLLSH